MRNVKGECVNPYMGACVEALRTTLKVNNARLSIHEVCGLTHIGQTTYSLLKKGIR